MQENKTDKVRAALERACIWDVEGAEYYRDALRELDGMVLVPVEPTEEMAEAENNVCPANFETRYRAMIATYVKGE